MRATSVPTVSSSPFARLRNAAGKKANDPSDDDRSGADDDDSTEGDDEDQEDDGDSEETKKKKAKRRAKKKADDDSDQNDEEEPETRAIRQRERARVATILNCAAAERLPAMARRLALQTPMPRHAAARMLAAAARDLPAPARAGADSLRDRMAGVGSPDVGADAPAAEAPAGSAKAIADSIIAAGKKRRGEA